MPCRFVYDRVLEWWRYRTNLEKGLSVAILLLILFILVLSITMSDGKSASNSSGVCMNSTCLIEASKLIRYMDKYVDPCKDFFKFACGKYSANAYEDEKLSFKALQTQQLLELYGEPINTDDHKMIKASKKFLQVCVNETGLEMEEFKTIKRVLKSVGGWPVLEGEKWDEENFDWLKVIYKLRKTGYYHSFFFDLQAVLDPEDNKSYMLRVFLEDMFDYAYDAFKVNKVEHMTNVAILLGAQDFKKAMEELTEVQKFFEKFETKKRDYENEMDHRYTITEYQQMSISINWLEFINKILGPTVQMNLTDYVLFPSPEMTNNRLDVIIKTKKRVLANYMMWKLVELSMPYLNEEMRNRHIRYRKMETHEEFCLGIVENMYSLSPIKIIWNEKYSTPLKAERLEEFLLGLKEEFAQKLSNFPWSKKGDKEKALQKVRAVTIISGIPRNYTTKKLLGELDVDMIDPESESLLDLQAQHNRNRQAAMFQQIKQAQSDKYFLKWERANMLIPFYLDHDNEIVLPAIIVNAFHFSENVPNYLNYGVVGAIIGNQFSDILLTVNTGNEILKKRTIDIQSKFSDKQLSQEEIQALAQQVITQQISYSTYRNWIAKHGEEPLLIDTNYTQNQLFWISAASAFCYLSFSNPPRAMELRWEPKIASILVTGSMRYNSDFINDFKCS